jgi:hypothetical protein
MNNQEVFDKVSTHLFTQGKPSMSKEMDCKYRYNGLSCAVGCLIPDSLYQDDLEGVGIQLILETDEDYKDIIDFFAGVDVELLSQLQSVHDDINNFESTEIMQEQLLYIAGKFCLNAGILSNISFKDR